MDDSANTGSGTEETPHFPNSSSEPYPTTQQEPAVPPAAGVPSTPISPYPPSYYPVWYAPPSYPSGMPPPYGHVVFTPRDSLASIWALAAAGWPAEAIALDLKLRGMPTLGKRLPFYTPNWGPYMVRKILQGEAPSAFVTLVIGLISLLVNPFLLASLASVVFFVQTRREIRDSGGQLRGTGKAATGLALGLVAAAVFVAVVGVQIYLAARGGL